MKPILYLHCGMYKTGSSFLQTMFVRNRDLLRSKGIHYPKSEQELEMYNGEITAGNGVHLSEAMAENKADVLKLLSADLIESKKLNLEGVLYSSEMLFHRFYEKGMIHKLERAVEEAGFGEIHALVYFRDPISHALSTYKHRAKYGDHQNFSSWLENKYEIFEQAEAFLDYSKDTQIKWACRRYNRDSAYMVTSSFVDWLGTEAPDIPEKDKVNPSLRLNEIRVLQSLKKIYPGSENFLREALLSLKDEDKKSDNGLKIMFSYLVAEKWHKHKSMLNSLNRLLNDDEKLTIEKVNEPSEYVPYTSLSEKQIQAVAEGINNYIQSQKLMYRLTDIWRRGLKKIKRKFVASKLSYKFFNTLN